MPKVPKFKTTAYRIINASSWSSCLVYPANLKDIDKFVGTSKAFL
jgi:hypothetical protein